MQLCGCTNKLLSPFTNKRRVKSNLRDPHSVASVPFDPCNQIPLCSSPDWLGASLCEDDGRPIQRLANAEDVNKLPWDELLLPILDRMSQWKLLQNGAVAAPPVRQGPPEGRAGTVVYSPRVLHFHSHGHFVFHF